MAEDRLSPQAERIIEAASKTYHALGDTLHEVYPQFEKAFPTLDRTGLNIALARGCLLMASTLATAPFSDNPLHMAIVARRLEATMGDALTDLAEQSSDNAFPQAAELFAAVQAAGKFNPEPPINPHGI